MKKGKKMTLHEMAVRLCEGGQVELNGLAIKAIEVTTDDSPCDVCEMDCLCRMAMVDLCSAVDAYDHKPHRLQLVNP